MVLPVGQLSFKTRRGVHIQGPPRGNVFDVTYLLIQMSSVGGQFCGETGMPVQLLPKGGIGCGPVLRTYPAALLPNPPKVAPRLGPEPSQACQPEAHQQTLEILLRCAQFVLNGTVCSIRSLAVGSPAEQFFVQLLLWACRAWGTGEVGGAGNLQVSGTGGPEQLQSAQLSILAALMYLFFFFFWLRPR